MASIFTKIINRDLPGYIVAEEEAYIAFLDIQPLVLGHVLVVPKQEVDDVFDLDDDVLCGLMVFAKKVAHALRNTVPCSRVGMAVVGLEVPHAHIHLIPLNGLEDIDFQKDKLQLSREVLEGVTAQLRTVMML